MKAGWPWWGGLALACGALVAGEPAAAERAQEPVVFEGLQLEAYEAGVRRLAVQAARGRAGRKRLGFFQTALVPTVELEEVTVRLFHADGAYEELSMPSAVLDWQGKALTTSTGRPMFHKEPVQIDSE